MKKILTVLGWVIGVVLVMLLSGLAYVSLALPDLDDAPALQVEATPERIANGAYLANHVLVCVDCHSKRDFSLFAGPVVPGTLGQGGEVFNEDLGFPGTFYSKNITPYGIKDWTDGELFRVITTGVTKDGTAIFPVMPYTHYGHMDPEDIKDVIAYLRTLSPIPNDVPKSEASFPFNFILNTIPVEATPVTRPPLDDTLAYGRYLAFSAGCFECHTKPDAQGKKLPGMDFAGGWEMSVGNGHVVTTANITPDPETGIGNWTEEVFVSRFKAYADSSYSPEPVVPGAFQTIMPWVMYAGMKEEDLKAIFAYLQSVEPITHKIEKFR